MEALRTLMEALHTLMEVLHNLMEVLRTLMEALKEEKGEKPKTAIQSVSWAANYN